MTPRVGIATVLALVVTIVLTGSAVADPPPTIPQARAKLVKLNERADEIVEKYNRATEAYKKAGKKHQRLNAELKRQSATADVLRDNLAGLAVNTYQYGGMDPWGSFMDSGGGSMALVSQMALTAEAELAAFEVATRELRERRDAAKTVLAEAKAAQAEIRTERAKVEKLKTQQTALLRRLGAFRVGNPDSVGITYTGPASGNARAALQFGFAQVGKPYQFGATGPGSYDCSGFTQASWRAAGVQLPRTTYEQWAWGATRRVSLDELQPGDLLFSKGLGHMGMYAGDGKMVHSPQTGDVVKVVDLDDYWRTRLLGAVRP
ncbi:C40 family peptidase [Herbidospora mongoliensis]|uniref:C40 family peptidase n=1 Tax=Herbidospora mongoliensis TaxID=688067 RepID=UPI000A62CA6A|nr:NlpC/P60 family protein [Herbidospora mongoliensis]